MIWIVFLKDSKRYTCYVDKEITSNGVKYYIVKGLGVTGRVRIDETMGLL
jgi:hypothetical protein